MNGRHAELHAALFASGQWLRQDASIHGQSLHHFAVVAQRVRVVDLLFENARRCKANAAHTPKQKSKDRAWLVVVQKGIMSKVQVASLF